MLNESAIITDLLQEYIQTKVQTGMRPSEKVQNEEKSKSH